MKLDLEQGSPEWLKARLGVITGSKINDCFTGKGAISQAGCDTLARVLASELVHKANNEEPFSFKNDAMIRGNELEPEAKEVVKELLGSTFENGGFYLDEARNIGASPDLVNGTGGVEIKCPYPKTHLAYLLYGQTPTDYYAQVQMCMLLTGASEWHFFSYYPGTKPFLFLQKRDEEFLKKVDEVVVTVNEKLKIYRDVLGV